MSERSGVEIDYCPQCRGVWLDRGELDKIIDRAADGFGGSAPAAPAAPPAAPAAPPAAAPAPRGHIPPALYDMDPRRDGHRPDERRFDDRYDERRDRPRYEQPRDDRRRPKKKEGWLGELFDF